MAFPTRTMVFVDPFELLNLMDEEENEGEYIFGFAEPVGSFVQRITLSLNELKEAYKSIRQEDIDRILSTIVKKAQEEGLSTEPPKPYKIKREFLHFEE